MSKQRNIMKAVCMALCTTALAILGFAGSASATLLNEFTKFQQCQWTNPEASKCVYSLTEGGEVVLGSKNVPIVNTVTLQGAFTKPVEQISKFIEAKNEITLSKTPQPVPGGLLGLVPPAGSPPLVKELVELAAKNGLTGVNATLELARPASEIRISEIHIAELEGVGLKLPVKVHLENPVLGNSCYVGSSTAPIIWELTTGITEPPAPNESISGTSGTVNFLESGRILQLVDNELVDNAWAAPSASGCGGLLSALVDPVLNIAAGLPAAAGHNSATLRSTTSIATAAAVKKVDEEG